MNLILPMNFRMTTPITPIGPSAFFILFPVDSVGGNVRALVGSEINVIQIISGESLLQLPKGASKICENVAGQQRFFARAVVEYCELGGTATSPCPNACGVEWRKL